MPDLPSMAPRALRDEINPLPQPQRAGSPAAAPPLISALWRGRIKDAIVAVSLANLGFIQAWFGLLFEADYGYYNKVPVTRAALAGLLLNMLWVSAAAWVGARWLRRRKSRVVRVAGCLMFYACLLIPLNFARLNVLHIMGPQVIAFAKTPAGMLAGVVALSLALWRHRWLARVAIACVVMLFPLTAFSLGKTAWWLLSPPAYPAPAAFKMPAVARPAPSPSPRVVCVIFDELDQRVGFTERPAGVQMPALERFSRQCVKAASAYPPEGSTLLSVPALTTGRPVIQAHPQSHNDLAITLGDTHETVGWSTLPNVFSRTKELGLKTAIVGWYHPYSRLFGGEADSCFWEPYGPFEQARAYTLGASMAHQLWAMATLIQQRRLHIRLYHTMQAQACRVATNADFNLVFLHLPVPHRPGIYVPRTGGFTLTTFSRRREYLDNLWLTDRAFDELRQAMEAAGAWRASWVVVSADHWWREAKRYDGREDHRVPFMIKAPGAQSPQTYAPPMNTLVTHDLILAVLRGELTGADQVVPWLDRHRIEPPPKYVANRLVD